MLWWLWILLGLALLALEMLTPGGFVLAFFGSAALLVGMLGSAGLAGPVWFQWLLFSVLSVTSMLLLRGRLLEWMKAREPADARVDSLVGQIAILLDELPAGGVGKAELRGTIWNVQSADTRGLSRGQRCRVEQVEGLTLFVRGL